MNDYRSLTREQIGDLFLNHWRYVDSSGKEGERAILHGFDLREADLTGANLRMCNLSQANLESANLREASLANALFYRTIERNLP